MSVDLAKAAYLKVEELALRVAALESGKSAPKYTSTDMSFKIYCKSSGTKTVSFRAIGEQNAIVAITVSTLNASCNITLNGDIVMLTNGTTNGQRLVIDGENELIFNFTNATNEWIDVSITIGGFLEKYEAERVLTAVGENYYSYFDDGTFYLCRAPSQTPVVTLYEVKHASANYTSSSGIFISYIDKNGVLKIQRYYSNGNLYVETTANGNYSRCLVRVKNGYVILYVIAGNYVKTGFVEFSGTTSLTRTNIRAKEITFRTIGAIDYMLVTDIDGNVYLCTISQTDYVSVLTKRSVGKLLNAKLSVAGGDLGICHYKGGAVVERVMNGNGFFPDGKITEGDEAIITDNGYKVIRTGYNLSIY